MTAIKTALAGGILFLLPFGLLALLVGEILDIALLVATPLTRHFPQNDVLGLSFAVILAWVLILLVCYLMGLLARWSFASRTSLGLTKLLSNILPGYRIIQANVAELFGQQNPEDFESKPILVQLGTMKRFGFEISRDATGGSATLYLPGSPDPAVGVVVSVDVSQVEELPISAGHLMKSLKFYGRIPIESAPDASGNGPHSDPDLR